MADYDQAVALWDEDRGRGDLRGDSREEISEYLKRNPGLSRVVKLMERLLAPPLWPRRTARLDLSPRGGAGEYRGHGVGKQLVDDCVDGLRKAGLKRAIILVAGDNPAGHQFWLRNGWEDIDGAIAMTKEL